LADRRDALGFQFDQPQDDVAVALAWPAHGREPVDDGRPDPDQALAFRVDFQLEDD